MLLTKLKEDRARMSRQIDVKRHFKILLKSLCHATKAINATMSQHVKF